MESWEQDLHAARSRALDLVYQSITAVDMKTGKRLLMATAADRREARFHPDVRVQGLVEDIANTYDIEMRASWLAIYRASDVHAMTERPRAQAASNRASGFAGNVLVCAAVIAAATVMLWAGEAVLRAIGRVAGF